MEYEKMHRAYRPTIGGYAIPANKLINDLKEQAVNYIGTFSEYNPIGMSMREDLAVYVHKEACRSINQQRAFSLPGFNLKGGGGYHGANYNSNSGVSFSKQDLFRLANAMDDTDTLCIDNVHSFGGKINVEMFLKGVREVTK